MGVATLAIRTAPKPQPDAAQSFVAAFGVTPEMRLRMVRDYATTVLGNEAAASSWLARVHSSILEGSCIASTACLTSQGFQDAMVALRRIHEQQAARLLPGK